MARILFIGSHSPHGPVYGAQLRTLHIARILKSCGDLGMVLVPFGDLDSADIERTAAEFDLRAVMRLGPRRPESPLERLRREFDPYCALTEKVALSTESLRQIERIAGEYDLVWFHGVFIPNCLGRRCWPNAVLDIDDIRSQVHACAARETGGLLCRVNAARQSVVWRRRERVLPERFGSITVCSESDRAYLGGGQRIHVIPNGFESPEFEPDRNPTQPPRVGFIGTLGYAPNLEGLRWFIRHAWPVIKVRSPKARLRLVGTGTDRGIAAEGTDIDGLGFVEDPAAEIATWSVSVVPINVGGGTRIKIAEAFSRKCPLVSTSLGAYGYQIDHGIECLLADSPVDMAEACVRIIVDPGLGDRMAQQAWHRFRSEWSWDAIAPRVHAVVDDCLGRGIR